MMKDILAKLTLLESDQAPQKSKWEEDTRGLDESDDDGAIEMSEAGPPGMEKIYSDSEQGVREFLQYNYDKSFLKRLDLPTCNIHADPSVEGVWAVDSMNSGYRCVIYLAGYRDPWGQKRDHNDSEEGSFTMSAMKRMVENEQLTPKLLKQWVKFGSLDKSDYDQLVKLHSEWFGESVMDEDLASRNRAAMASAQSRYDNMTPDDYYDEDPPMEECPECHGNGWYKDEYSPDEPVTCERCDGTGEVPMELDEPDYDPPDDYYDESIDEAAGDKLYEFYFRNGETTRIGAASMEQAIQRSKKYGGDVISIVRVTSIGKPIGKPVRLREMTESDGDGFTGAGWYWMAPDKVAIRAAKKSDLQRADNIGEGYYVAYLNDMGNEVKRHSQTQQESVHEAAERRVLNLQVIEYAKLDPRSGQGTADGYCYDANDEEIPVEIEFDYSLSERDNGDADSWTPGPGHDTEVDITRVTDENGIEIPVEDIAYDMDSLIEAVEEAAGDRMYGESATKNLKKKVADYNRNKGDQTGREAQKDRMDKTQTWRDAEGRDFLGNKVQEAVSQKDLKVAADAKKKIADSEKSTKDKADKATDNYKKGNVRANWVKEGAKVDRMVGEGKLSFKDAAKELNKFLKGKGYKVRKFSERGDNGFEWIGKGKTIIQVTDSRDGMANWAIGSIRNNGKKDFGTSGNDPIEYFADSIIGEYKDYFREETNEGAKVDRMVGHIKSSEKKLGKSAKDAESIAWATANKRGMLDNKNKKTEGKVIRKYKFIAEGQEYNVGNPHLAKILRRFPHEVAKFNNEGELDDHLYEALFDHYFDEGEMPYGVAKGREGDPFNWVSDRLDGELNGRSFGHPADAKDFAMGEGAEVVDEMSELERYRMKQRMSPSTPAQTGMSTLRGKGFSGGGSDSNPFAMNRTMTKPGMGSAGTLSSNFESLDEDDLDPMDPDWTEDDVGYGDKQEWDERNPMDMDSAEPIIDPDEDLLTEGLEDIVTEILSNVGLDHGLDFFFDGGLVVIGKSTAKVVINALKADPQITKTPSIESIDGEEVRISFDSGLDEAIANDYCPTCEHDTVTDFEGNCKLCGTDKDQDVTESRMGEVDMVMQDIVNGNSDLYDVMNHPRDAEQEAASKILNDMYADIANEHGYHQDDDFEKINARIMDQLEADYAPLDEAMTDAQKARMAHLSGDIGGLGSHQMDLNTDYNDAMRLGDKETAQAIKKKMAQLAAYRMKGQQQLNADVDPMTEDVNLNISANGEEDVLNVIRKLSGLGSAATATEPTATITATDVMEPQGMSAMIGKMDALSEPQEELEVEEQNFANSVDDPQQPQVHTSTTDMINQGNDLNRPKKSYSSKPYRGDNPMAESHKLMRQYESMLKGVKGK